MTGFGIGRGSPCKSRAKIVALSIGIAAFGAGETQAAVQPSLDLVCSPRSGQPIHFRFALEQRKWCFGECQSVWTIDELGDAMIKLSVQSMDGSDYWTINIDRYASKFWAVRSGYGNAPADEGQCKVAPFSGFPQKKF